VNRSGWGAGALALSGATLYSAFAVAEHQHLRTATYDLVIFDQAVRHYSSFGAPVSAAKGVHNGFGPQFSILGDHFSPIIALWTPLYWLSDSPVTLLVAQAVLLAASVIPVWMFTRRAMGETAAYLVGAAYLLAWEMQGALAADVHEVAFGVPLLAVAIERWHAGRNHQALVAVLALLLVKEDMGLIVAAFAVLFVIRRHWRMAAVVAVGGLAVMAIATLVLIPAAGGRADYYWSYDALGADLPAAIAHVFAHPVSTLQLLVTPDAKWHTLLWLLLPLGLLSLLSPISILAVPVLLERFLSANPNYWTTDHHYNALLLPIVMLAAVDGLSRLLPHLRSRWRPVAGPAYAGAVLVVAVVACAHFPFERLVRSDEWTSTAETRAADRVLESVPPGVVVEAGNKLGPQLTRRDTVLLLDREPRGAPWVVADVQRGDFPFTAASEVQARVQWLQQNGYRIVASVGGFVALTRVDA
jgi:uncharacterized membrane protein